MSDKESYSQMERRLSAMMDRLTMDAFYGNTTSKPQEQEPFTAEKLRKLIDDLPPAPPRIQATPDYLFPQEHYADEVAIIPHHPAHTFFAKMLNPKSPTATVMKSRQNGLRARVSRGQATGREYGMSEKTMTITEDDLWLLASAAENLRGGGQNEEKRVEAAFRIAFKLDELRKRIDAALKE